MWQCLTSEEADKLSNWDKEHDCDLKKDSGAIGGRLTFMFTYTTLGTVIKVKCVCGEEIDLTNYSW